MCLNTVIFSKKTPFISDIVRLPPFQFEFRKMICNMMKQIVPLLNTCWCFIPSVYPRIHIYVHVVGIFILRSGILCTLIKNKNVQIYFQRTRMEHRNMTTKPYQTRSQVYTYRFSFFVFCLFL